MNHDARYNLMRVIARRMGNLPTNFGVSGTFPFRHMGQQLSDVPLAPAILTFSLGGQGAVTF